MCEKCGCSDPVGHRRSAEPAHAHVHSSIAGELAYQDRLAERNRGFLRAKCVFAVNLIAFSGSGAAGFVARTLAECGPSLRIRLLNGALLESIHADHRHDGVENRATAEVVEHAALDAHAVGHALEHLDLDSADVLLMQNGGSAACQSVNDLGETARVALLSTRDGEHKPLKFPLFFAGAAAVVIHASDAPPAGGFHVALARRHLETVNPRATIIDLTSAADGLRPWLAFLQAGVAARRTPPRHGMISDESGTQSKKTEARYG